MKIGTTQAQRKLFFNLRKEREKLEQLGFQPTAELLAEKLDVPEKEVIEMERRLAAPEASLDAPLGGDDDDGGRTRLDYLPSDGEHAARRAVAHERVPAAAARQARGVRADARGPRADDLPRALLTDEPLTLQEIGERYGVSRERARQLEKRLKKKLRNFLQSQLGDAVQVSQN